MWLTAQSPRTPRLGCSSTWIDYGACPESLSSAVSCPCCAGGWLLQGKVRVDQESGELKLLVKVNSQGAGVDQRAKAVKDLKQLSGNQ